jgi:hypothetical protein
MQQLVRLFVALFSPPFLVLRVMIWVTISQLSHLWMSSPPTILRTSILELSPAVQGYLDASSYLFLAAGVVVYYRFFRRTSFRTIFFISQIASAIFFASDIPLNEGWVSGWGVIPFLFAGSALTEVIDRLNSMPFLIMAGQLCPDNMEATFFAALMSVSNLGSTFSEYLASFIITAYDLESENLDNFQKNYTTVLLIRSGTLIGACVFLFLLPNTSALNPTNVETLRPTNPTIIKVLKWADMYNGDEDVTRTKKVDAAKETA